MLDLGQHILKMILHYSAGWYLQSVNDSWRSVKFKFQLRDRSQVSAKILTQKCIRSVVIESTDGSSMYVSVPWLQHLKICLRKSQSTVFVCSALPCLSLLATDITLTHRCHWPNKGRSNCDFGRVSRFLGSVHFFFRLSVQQWIEWCQRCKFKRVYLLKNSIFMLLNIVTGGALQTLGSEQ